jgi:hypothetical protein
MHGGGGSGSRRRRLTVGLIIMKNAKACFTTKIPISFIAVHLSRLQDD